MRLIVGDSHVHFAFSEVSQISVTNCLKIIQTPEWTGLSHRDGLTIYSAAKNIEEELLTNKIDISSYKSITCIFGTNDAIVRREKGLSPKEYVKLYINSIESIRKKYKIPYAYVITPFYLRHLDDISHWDPIRDKMNTYSVANSIIKSINDSIVVESKKYSNVHVIKMIDIFSCESDLFCKEYTLDGVHFNKKGRTIFFNKIYATMALIENR